jgi:hypothetical protein
MGLVYSHVLVNLANKEFFMSTSISNTFPQAPLVIPKPIARAITPTVDSGGDNDGTKSAKAAKASVAFVPTAAPVPKAQPVNPVQAAHDAQAAVLSDEKPVSITSYRA